MVQEFMLSLILTWFTVVVGFVGGFLDLHELENVDYGIDISDTPLLHPSELPSDAVILSSKYGQLYQCTYPPIPSQANTKENESDANNVTVSQLLNPMKQLPCLFSNKGWWTYEFCYGREIKQYHSEDGKIVGDVIILGEYDVRNDIINASEKDNEKQWKSLEHYHRHFYVNGTLCDLTGRLRQAEVRFVCQEGHGDFISSVDERETCSYVVTVHTSRICAHPLYGSPPSIKPLSISCNPLLNAPDYEMYMKEFPADNKASASAEDSQPDKKDESTGIVKKLLIESMLKSVQSVLKQQQIDRQPADTEGTEVTSEQETDGVTMSSESDETAVNEVNEDESGESQSSDSEDVIDSSTHTSHAQSERSDGSGNEADAEAGSTASSEDDDDDSTVDDEDDNDGFVKEFENEMKDIISTAQQKARLAKHSDTIASAMQAKFSNILQEAQADMTREGEDVAAVDKDAVLKNLEKTLHLLLERLEKMKTGEEADDDSSDISDTETETTVSDAKEELETTGTVGDDGGERSSDDAGDSATEDEQGLSESETSEESVEVFTKGEMVDKDITASQETLRDRLEKAGVRTSERKLDLKVITAGATEYTSVQMFSEEDGSPTGRIVIAIIGDDDDAVKEQERSQRLEENYRFKWNKNDNEQR